jgi:tripartite-type tricarboxylate transporter receptor subunit TctC
MPFGRQSATHDKAAMKTNALNMVQRFWPVYGGQMGWLFLLVGILELLTGITGVMAQTYPARPITMVVPFAAGGPMDVVARLVAEGMRTSLGQPIIIENVAGAGGSIGVGRCARAAPDGYTLCYGGWPTHVINGAVYALPYNALTDFEPISLTATAPWLIAAKNDLPADDLQGLIAWLQANPDKATAGTAGAGSAPHVFGASFQYATNTRFQFVSYRGTSPALQDLVAGRIDLLFDSPATALPQVRAGRIKAYATTSKSRLASAPHIPTAIEAGLPGFDISSWHALWAPRGTPKDIVSKLNFAVTEALKNPVMRQRLSELDQEIPSPSQQTSEALGTFQKAEIEKWWPIMKAANIKGD